ncbi:MAG: hypothetical protein ABI813_08380 [Bacteroidota bacterium]
MDLLQYQQLRYLTGTFTIQKTTGLIADKDLQLLLFVAGITGSAAGTQARR